jgi:hypothetical protein
MIITLSDGTTTLTLPESLEWTNEFNWHAVAQQRQYTVTGALWLHSSALAAGRPIVLQAGDDRGWTTRTDVLALAAWAAQPGLELELVIDGVSYDVVFDHEGGALESRPVMFFSDPQPGDRAAATLRFITI